MCIVINNKPNLFFLCGPCWCLDVTFLSLVVSSSLVAFVIESRLLHCNFFCFISSHLPFIIYLTVFLSNLFYFKKSNPDCVISCISYWECTWSMYICYLACIPRPKQGPTIPVAMLDGPYMFQIKCFFCNNTCFKN
jgi:hypothetical protein